MIKEHPHFYKDLDNLSMKNFQIFCKKIEKIKENPLRMKHLRGKGNCYREPITKSVRLIYEIKGHVIILLSIGPHDKSYRDYLKRWNSLS